MLQQPKKVRYNKFHKNKVKSSKNVRKTFLSQNEVNLVSKQSGILKSSEIATVKKIVGNILKQKQFYKIVLRIFPHFSKTKKPLETRMGKGKGLLDFWFAKIRKGQLLCTITGVNRKKIVLALEKASKKISLKTFLQ